MTAVTTRIERLPVHDPAAQPPRLVPSPPLAVPRRRALDNVLLAAAVAGAVVFAVGFARFVLAPAIDSLSQPSSQTVLDAP